MSDEHKRQIFKTELGSKAIVQREELGAAGDSKQECVQRGGAILRMLGGQLFLEGVASPGVEYLGSFACHIYAAPITRTMQFVMQETTLDATPPDVANAAVRETEAAVKKYYGMRSSKLRSGIY